MDAELASLEDQVASAEDAMAMHAQQAAVLAEQHAELRSRIVRHNERRTGLQSEVGVSRTELSGLNADIVRDECQWQDFLAKADVAG